MGLVELIFLLCMLAFMGLLVAAIVWIVVRVSRKSSHAPARTVAERLAELESLRKAEQITAAEYEKQRALIVSSV